MKKGGGLSVGGNLKRGGSLGPKAKIAIGSTLVGLGGASFLGAPGNLGGIGLIAGGSKLINKGRNRERTKIKRRANRKAEKKYSSMYENNVGGQLKIGGGLSTGGIISGRRPMTKPYYGRPPMMIQTNRGGNLVRSTKRFFEGKSKIKPSTALYGLSGISTIASLNPAFAPIAAPVAGLSLGGARIAQAFGAGGKKYKPKKRKMKGRKKGGQLKTGGRIKKTAKKSMKRKSKYKSRI